MFDHIQFNVKDYAKSVKFYDAVLSALGYAKLFETGEDNTRRVGYGKNAPQLWLAEGESNSGKIHIALRAENKRAVQDFYSKGLAAGGYDNGEPGYRPAYYPGYYAAFLTDIDGNNIEAIFHDIIN
ncbi:VOC family protein [Rahnella bruchi]|uniref:VOC family protein n=1 Tax=Rahnella bruchi TaxID=1510573 RepID=UPI000EA12D48|nr:VOC family protein [Rahnella bruchi]